MAFRYRSEVTEVGLVLERPIGAMSDGAAHSPQYSNTPILHHSIRYPFGPPLPREFYARRTSEVARGLLGRVLARHTDEGMVAGVVVEAEAYGPDDAANHAHRGQSPRNAVMFGEPGHAYVYLSYGVHWMINAVTVAEGVGEAVLIRALEPVAGIELMKKRRGIEDIRRLCAGPGSLCRALGITIEQNGADLLGPNLYFAGDPPVRSEVVVTKRIGITKSADLPWRFYLAGSPFVSRK
jgi:DNA-3-methyladenine glycosylase